MFQFHAFMIQYEEEFQVAVLTAGGNWRKGEMLIIHYLSSLRGTLS